MTRARGRGRGGAGFHGGNGGLGFDQAELLRQLTSDAADMHGARGSWRGRGRGGARGSYNGQQSNGTATPQSDSSRGSFRGRGRGRGGGSGRGRGRGGALGARNQNAVGFNYGSISAKARIHDEQVDDAGTVMMNDDDDDDDGDVIIEPRKNYKHTVRPHLENGSASPPAQRIERPSFIASNDRSTRASSSIADLERAQRIQTGQVASLIPTGPRAAQVHRLYGTEEAMKKPRNANLYRRFDDIDNTPPAAAPSRFKTERAPPDPFDDACLGGIPRSMRSRPARENRESFPTYAKSSSSFAAPTFVKAEGEWRDGVWIRAADGKAGMPGQSSATPSAQSSKMPNAAEKTESAGLGFAKKMSSEGEVPRALEAAPTSAPAPLQPAVDFDMDAAFSHLQQGGEGTDSIDALLQAFPGSSELEQGDEIDASLAYYAPTSGFAPGDASSHSKKYISMPKAPTPSSEDDDEVILLPHRSHIPAEITTDGDESDIHPLPFQQSDASVAGAVAIGEVSAPQTDLQLPSGTVPARLEEDSFVVDLTGEDSEARLEPSSQSIKYDPLDVQVIGDARTEAVDEDSDYIDEQADVSTNVPTSKPTGRKARNAAKKARRRAKMGRAGEPAIPREGDSDLEWGSDGPPQVEFKDQDAQEMFTLADLRLAEVPKDAEDEERLLAIALSKSVAESEHVPRPSKNKSERELLLEDYAANAMGNSDESDMEVETRNDAREDDTTELDAMISFMQSMDGQGKGRETTMEDVAAERQIRQEDEDEWETDSGISSSGSSHFSDENESDEVADAAISRDERRLMDEQESNSDADSSDDDSDHDSEDDSDGSSSDDEDEAFAHNFTWADADEDFIDRIDKFARANGGLLKGRNRAARNKLFKAIESGDFTGIDGGLSGGVEDMDIANDPVFADQTAPRGKQAKKKKWQDDDLWAAELQEQWQKDRSKKADNKRKRAEQRALAADSPFHNTNASKGKPGGKKAAKKAARAERRAQRQIEKGVVARSRGANWSDDDDDDFQIDGRANILKHHARSMVEVNDQIMAFLQDMGKTTLSMPPMDKHARAQVHQLALAYSLKSQSQGSGHKRYTILTKTSRSGMNIKQSKINAIVRRATGSLGVNGRGPNKTGSGTGSARREKAGPVPRNVEGSAVGFGAERIGEDNIGHRLLMSMGWTEGSGVGATRGMSDPVGATIKISRGGLGF